MEKQFKAPRELAEIQREYVQLCTRAGDLAYKIDCHKRDLALVTEALRDLNFEAAAAQAEANKKAAEAAKQAAEQAQPKLAAVEGLEEVEKSNA